MDTLGYDQVPARNTNAVLGDSYVLGRRIGRGAMGEVYEAQHVRLPGTFAVKLLLPELHGNQDAFARFCREAEIMSQLRHPNIVQIFDFNLAPDSRPYFVMEYLEGRDLEARLQAGAMPLPAITRIVDAVASALALAHAHGVVHRDLKPANIFLATVDGQTDELVKVLDFGISKVRSAVAQISHAVDVLGTPSYMAPEQARGQVDAVDGRTDQFALGALAYRMLTGSEPFHGDDAASVLYQVVHEDPPPLSLFLPSNWDPAPLQAVLDRALAKQPARRFGGMMELARAFDDAAERTIGTGREADGGGGGGAGRRAAPVQRAPRLDDAVIAPGGERDLPARALRGGDEALSGSRYEDAPPPVRTPTPVIVSPPRRIPTTPPVPPPRGTPQIIDWEVPSGVDELPKTHTRAAVVGLLLLAIVGMLIVTGWYKKVPRSGAALRQRIHEWTRPPGGEPAATAPAPAPAPAPPDETGAAPERERRGAAAQENVQPAPEAAARDTAAPSAEAAPGRVESAPSAAAPAARPRAETKGRDAPPEKPRAHRAHAAHGPVRSPITKFTVPPPAAPPADDGAPPPAQVAPATTPPLNGKAFEIAPPTTAPIEPRRDLAPGNDDTLPPSPP